MPDTRPHPWAVASFPSSTSSFCKLGCQYFFTVYTTKELCLKNCDFTYRYKVTTGYSDIAEVRTNINGIVMIDNIA